MPTPRLRQYLQLSALLVALLVGCRRESTQTPQPDPSAEGSPGDAKKPGPGEADEGHEHGEFESGEQAELDSAPVGPRTRDKLDPPQTRDAALIAVSHGNPEGAIEFLTKHLGKTPDDHEAALALAWAQRLVGKRKEAEKTLGDLAKRTKDKTIEVEAMRRLARLARMRGDAKQAEQLLRDATKLAPDDLLIQGELVNILVLTGRRDAPEARQMVDALYDAYGNGSAQTAGELLGAAHAGLAEFAFKSANRVLGEAESAAPASSGSELADEIAMLRAGVFLEKYRPQEAGETLAMILERDPWNSEALAMLSSHSWPGNVRELRNVLTRAVLLCNGGAIRGHHLALESAPERAESSPSLSPPPSSAPTPRRDRAMSNTAPMTALRDAEPPPGDDASLGDQMRALERARILETLERYGGNQTRAARALSISRGTLIARLTAYGIIRPRKA